MHRCLVLHKRHRSDVRGRAAGSIHNQTVTRNPPPKKQPPPNQILNMDRFPRHPVTEPVNQPQSSQFPHQTCFFSNTSTVGAAVGALALTAGTIPGNGRTGGHRRSRSYKSHIIVTHPTSCPRWSSTIPAWCFSDLLWRREQTAPY